MQNLTEEQKKRIDLLEAYEAKTAPDLNSRNDSIDKFENQYREKWLQMQSSMEATRGDVYTKMKAQNSPEQAISATIAMELAKATEGYYVEKDKAARELDKSLPQPQSWKDFLKEGKQQHPDDPSIDGLIEEAEKVGVKTIINFS